MKRIPIEPSFATWRRAARVLLRQGSEPLQVEWVESEAEAGAATPGVPATESAFATAGASGPAIAAAAAPGLATPVIPRELLSWLKTAACFRAPDRWALLYRVLWRWTRSERNVLDPGDPDGALLDQRIRTIERETEDLLTLTLFRRRDPSMGPPEFVGWYEPHHDLLERAAVWFAERMGNSTWMLATPHGAVFWNGMLLRTDRPLRAQCEQAAPASAASAAGALSGEAVTSTPTEALWLAYYSNAVNSLPSPVPLRYWRMPPAGPPLPAHLARERSRLGAQSAAVTVPRTPPVEYSAATPPCRSPLARSPPAGAARYGATRNRRWRAPGPHLRRSW